MCDTEDKKALLSAVSAALAAYEAGDRGAALGRAMGHLRGHYDKIERLERLAAPSPPPRKGQARLDLGDEAAGPLFSRKRNPSAPTSGYRVSVLGPKGERLYVGEVETTKGRAWDGWLVRRAGVVAPFSKATLYKVSKHKGTAVKIEQLDPHGLWVALRLKGAH